MPSPATILPDPIGLPLLGLAADTASMTATVSTPDPGASCPLCGHPSTPVHSRYTRRLADLPWHGMALRRVLPVRQCFCDNVSCARRVVTERLPEVVAPSARRTLRLAHGFTVVGFAAGGAVGARLLRELGLVATPALVLARLRADRSSHSAPPRV